jgi:predicted transcriptional regulator
LVHEYRDRIYIRKDVLLKLYEYGELNQSKLMSYCGLNNVKHREIIEEMVRKEIILRTEEAWGNKIIIKYRAQRKEDRYSERFWNHMKSFFQGVKLTDNNNLRYDDV